MNEFSKNILLSVIHEGLNHPNRYFNTERSDAIGSSISLLLCSSNDDKYFDENRVLIKPFASLAYLFLSSFINKMGNEMCDSFSARSRLMRHQWGHLILEDAFGPTGIEVDFQDVYTMYDDWQASYGYFNQGNIEAANIHQERVKDIHSWLEDRTVSGKDSDDSSLMEKIELSKLKHLSLFDKLLKKYENNDILETTIGEFLEILSELNLK